MLNRRNQQSSPHPRQGVIAVLVAISLVAIMGALALALDGGRMLDRYQHVQAAAEASALAAGLDLLNHYYDDGGKDTLGTARASALAIAASNGYANNGAQSVVTINIPPKQGAQAGKFGYAEAIIEYRQTRAFSKVFGSSTIPVKARVVAGGTFRPSWAGLLILEPKKDHAMTLRGNASLTVAGDIIVNSKGKHPIQIDSHSHANADSILVAGTLSSKDRKALRAVEDLFTGMPPTPDPLADLPAPTKGTVLDPKHYITGANGKDSNTYALVPGTYKGPLTFDHNDAVKMAPGTYYIDGGGLNFKNTASLAASGVMIYNSSKKPISFQSSGDITLTPPTSGTYRGISLFQARVDKARVSFKKDANLSIGGTIYAPTAEVRFQKSDVDIQEYPDNADDDLDLEGDDETDSAGSLSAQIIAAKFKVDKNSQVTIGGAGIATQKPFLGLVE
jgi:hypothetical protein